MLELSYLEEVRAKKLHDESLVFDAHCDTILALLEKERSLGEKSQKGHIDIPRLISGGINAQIFAVFVRPEWYHNAVHATMKGISILKREIHKNSEKIRLVDNFNDIEDTFAQGKIAALLSIEGGKALQGDLDMISIYRELGVTSLVLTWNNRNAIADGALDFRSKGGLSEFGVKVIREMEKVGMIVDVSHISPKAFWDVIDVATKPLIVSHSLPRSLSDTPRNLDDEQIRAVSTKGGVIGVSLYFASYGGTQGTIENVLDAIDYFVNIGGIDHVGLGSDFDGFSGTVLGLETCEQMINITRGMISRGYSDEEIQKVLGKNFLRVFKETL